MSIGKRLALVVIVGFAVVAGSAHAAGARTSACTLNVTAHPESGYVYGTAYDTCGASVRVCLEGISEQSGWSAPFDCSGWTTGTARTPNYSAGCGYGNVFRAVAQDANLGSTWFASNDVTC